MATAIEIIEKYSRMPSQRMRLLFGELTANEIKAIRAVLQAITRDISNEQNKESNN